MFDLDHGTVVAFAKSFGLFYLIAMSAAVLVYTFWPAKKKQFEEAARNVIHDEDAPWH